MYPVLFLTNKEINLLKGKLDSKIRNWLKKYTLTSDLDINISRVKFNDFDGIKGHYLDAGGQGILVKYREEDFVWENLIFSSLSHLCPRDSVLLEVVSSIKESFFKEILGFSIDKKIAQKTVRSVFDAYLKIHVSSRDVGDLTLLVSDSVFSSLIEKKMQHPPVDELQRVANAAASINVPLTFSLDFGAIDFTDILKMDVGNVVISNQELKNQISVSLCDSARAVAAMGKKDNNLAFIFKELIKDDRKY